MNAGYEWFKHVFSVISGKGNTSWNEDFRCDIIISSPPPPDHQVRHGRSRQPDVAAVGGHAHQGLQRLAGFGAVQRPQRR